MAREGKYHGFMELLDFQDTARIEENARHLTSSALFLSAPIKMTEILYDGFEKTGKKQNKEQVPPPAEPQNKKPLSSKSSKKSQSSSTVTPATHKTLEEAFKAVSKARRLFCGLFTHLWHIRRV